jgi:hypothetical protein
MWARLNRGNNIDLLSLGRIAAAGLRAATQGLGIRSDGIPKSREKVRVERLTGSQEVASSILVSSTIFFPSFFRLFLDFVF